MSILPTFTFQTTAPLANMSGIVLILARSFFLPLPKENLPEMKTGCYKTVKYNSLLLRWFGTV